MEFFKCNLNLFFFSKFALCNEATTEFGSNQIMYDIEEECDFSLLNLQRA